MASVLPPLHKLPTISHSNLQSQAPAGARLARLTSARRRGGCQRTEGQSGAQPCSPPPTCELPQRSANARCNCRKLEESTNLCHGHTIILAMHILPLRSWSATLRKRSRGLDMAELKFPCRSTLLYRFSSAVRGTRVPSNQILAAPQHKNVRMQRSNGSTTELCFAAHARLTPFSTPFAPILAP